MEAAAATPLCLQVGMRTERCETAESMASSARTHLIFRPPELSFKAVHVCLFSDAIAGLL